MTLIIAGYNYSKSLNFNSLNLTGFVDEETTKPYVPKMKVDGLFIVSDSAITTQGETLLNEFKKVYELEAKLWKPSFRRDGSFQGYQEVCEIREFFIGFAGSTLIAQHIINHITEHLGKLRISYSRDGNTNSIKYKVIRHCQSNPLFSTYWDDETFLDTNFDGLLQGCIIAEFIEYSINNALYSASSCKCSIKQLQEMHTDIVLGVWCPYKNRHELYEYRYSISDKPNDDGVLIAYAEKKLLPETEIAVLGMQAKFETEAQKMFDNALSNYLEPARAMYSFLNDAIDGSQQSGSKEISKSVSFRTLNRLGIKRLHR